jgi:hypothetical protein
MAKQFTKKAPRPNVNAAYRNKVANVLPTEESLIPGVIAAGQAVRSRLNRSYPRSKYYYNSKQAYNNIYKETYGGSRKRGTRRTHRTWKQTKRTQKHTSKNKDNTPSSPLGRGIVLNTNNSNSNSSNSNSNSSSNNNSLFSRNSNESSNNSSNNSSNENEYEEELSNGNSPRPNSRLRFAKTRRVKRINQSGKSKSVPKGHQTKTRRQYGTNVKVNVKVSRDRYAAARLVAAAHKQSYSYDEMKEFIERARAPTSVKLLALHRIKMRYPDFGK